MQVSAQLYKGDYAGQSVTVEYPLLDAENLQQLIDNFGEAAVFDHAKRSFVVGLQSFLRTQIETGKSQEDIQASSDDWRPGQRRPGKSPQEKIQELFQRLDPAAKQALLKEMRPKKSSDHQEQAA
jgi:hypothetical protein